MPHHVKKISGENSFTLDILRTCAISMYRGDIRRAVPGTLATDRHMSESQDREDFVQQLTRCQQRITVYVRSLLPQLADYEEVLQEINLYLWRNADDFEPGTDFTAWALRVAYFHVLTYRKQTARERARLSDTVVEQLAEHIAETANLTDLRQEALRLCLGKLERNDRELIDLRYAEEQGVAEVAENVGRSKKAVANSLSRVRGQLLDCIQRALSREDQTR